MKKTASENHAPVGLLTLDKPLGITSFDAVRQIKRHLHTGEVGHAGTLDPLASGVLVVAVGRATKLIRFVQELPKTYIADVAFHQSSATGDAEGPLVPVAEAPRLADSQLRAALPHFIGEHDQLPPAYSAKKIAGRRAYDMAREGETPELKPCRVVAYEIDLLECACDAAGGIDRARVRCKVGSGYYVRSFARDLGRALGTEAYLAGLRRTAIGPFVAEQAVTWDCLGGESAEPIRRALASPWLALAHLPQWLVSEGEAVAILQGKSLTWPTDSGGAPERAVAVESIGPVAVVCRQRDGSHKIDLNLIPLRQALAKTAIP